MALHFRNRLLLAKIQPTPDVDPAPAAADAIKVENLRIENALQLEQTNAHTGSLDMDDDIEGGTLQRIRFDVKAKGSGTAATPPEWGKLLKACGWAETITATAIGAAPQAAAAGSATTVTGGTNFAATAQLYRGMPLLLTGNPAAGAYPFIADYTAGKVFTLTDTFSPVLDASTLLQIPANVLYTPASTSIPMLAFWAYRDGKLIKMLGSKGKVSGSLRASGALTLSFQFFALPVGESDAAVLASPVLDQTTVPTWRNVNSTGMGAAKLNKLSVGIANLTFDDGMSVDHPENPNRPEGFDEADHLARKFTGRIDPNSVLVATQDRLAQLRAGTRMSLHARLGTAAGNRLGLTFPAIAKRDLGDQDRRGFDTDAIAFQATGRDSGMLICCW